MVVEMVEMVEMVDSVLGIYTSRYAAGCVKQTNKTGADMQVRGEVSGPRSKRRQIDRQRPSKDPLIRSDHPTLTHPVLSSTKHLSKS